MNSQALASNPVEALLPLVPLALIFVVFYFLLLRPRLKKSGQKQTKPKKAGPLASLVLRKAGPNIFISYRREDSSGYARGLYAELVNHLGRDHVFMDVDTIELGRDFVESIDNAIGSCAVVLVLIGPTWLVPRLRSPDDYVRIEIVAALGRKNVRVIPVLIEGATMPPAGELPDDLAPLTRRHGLALSHEHFQADVQHLLTAIRSP